MSTMTMIKSPPSRMESIHNHLSSTAILVLAANTMNGPGITTLPDVAANAGRTLYILLIACSAGMAAFVCRRMVYAMWHMNYDNINIDTITAMREGSVELLEVINKYDENENSSFGSSSRSTITETTNLLLRSSSNASELPSDRGNTSNSGGRPPQPILERTSIVGQSREAFDDNNYSPNKELSCRRTTNPPPSTYVALLMVASALCLGLAQMVRI